MGDELLEAAPDDVGERDALRDEPASLDAIVRHHVYGVREILRGVADGAGYVQLVEDDVVWV